MEIHQPPPAESEDLAVTIRRIADGMDRLIRSGLKKNAVVVLLKDATGVGKRDIELVLAGLAGLAKQYTTEPAKK